MNLKTFAATLKTRAAELTTTRPDLCFGDDRVFLCHVWSLCTDGMSRKEFIAAVLECNRLRLLSLARADMVELMNPVDVSDSRIESGNSTYHFLAL